MARPYDWASEQGDVEEPVGILCAPIDVDWEDDGWCLQLVHDDIQVAVFGVSDAGLRTLLGPAAATAVIARREEDTEIHQPSETQTVAFPPLAGESKIIIEREPNEEKE
jgi:hypothetical protein